MELNFTKTEKLTDPEVKIRHTVFEAEQGFVDEFDEIDKRSTHIIAFDASRAVGVCRIFREEDPAVWFLGRLAVVKEYRGEGVGRALIRKRPLWKKAPGRSGFMPSIRPSRFMKNAAIIRKAPWGKTRAGLTCGWSKI